MAELATSTISLDQAYTQLIAADLNATVVGSDTTAFPSQRTYPPLHIIASCFQYCRTVVEQVWL